MPKDLDENEKELKAAYALLKETQAQLIQSSKLTALGELSAGLAHELNQPLTVIKGLSQYLLRSCGPQSQDHEKLKLIVEASNKMEQVIKHLMIFARSETLAFKPVDINNLINDVFPMVKELLVSGSVEIVLDLKPVPTVLGSAGRLEQVVINIVANAKDAMPDGGRLTISSFTEVRGKQTFARLAVSDTGCGIPEDVKERIFDPFFTTKEAGKGTGLGLSISYGIIKEHGGEITVESAAGKGTAFHITIPAGE
ncbi:MAG: hypothetical protein HY884_05820 [Deltaproteobacteria bacterium]|nr:hypothetical protein [Deltaproteobacteria bacterium]